MAELEVSRGHLREIQDALQAFGHRGEERFVLLTARATGYDRMRVCGVYVPEQTPVTHRDGFSVTVGGDELHRLNVEWVGKNERLVAQVHSHPSYPFHSPTDDRYAMVTAEGGLSIVVPLFGFCSLTDLRGCAVFRLWDGQWLWMSSREVERLVRLI
jgi:hypothetical protein